MNDIIEVKSAEIVEAINRSEVDMQITTAKRYPRDIARAIDNIATLACSDPETAAECFYVLRRQGGYGASQIEGLSVRMAEIIASCWGNLRIAMRIVANDGKTITAQGICHDLETNVAVNTEVKRRITDKNGRTFSEDMQVVTGNAACAIAMRNAVLKVVPKAITKRAIEEVKRVAMGQSLDMETSRQNLVLYFQRLGVSEEQLLDFLGIANRSQITKDMVFTLRGIKNAIAEGSSTIEEVFVKPAEEKKQTEAAKAKAQEAKAKAQKAAARQQKAVAETPAPEVATTAETTPEASDEASPVQPMRVDSPRTQAAHQQAAESEKNIANDLFGL